MPAFHFQGPLPASKSLMNRLLIVQSYQPNLGITGNSRCEDVQYMHSGLTQLAQKSPIQCGNAGTVFRFLAITASRQAGRHELTGSRRLLSRPHDELINILQQLSIQPVWTANGLEIQSQGWKKPPKGRLWVSTSVSTQFASAILLNSWNLEFDLTVELTAPPRGYLKMTTELLQKQGMNLEISDREILVPAGQQPRAGPVHVEMDLSSAFAVAALATVAGHAHLEPFPFDSLQPDAAFPAILQDMGVPLEIHEHSLLVQKAKHLQPGHWSLHEKPDLFPVLAMLTAVADGTSQLDGAPQLAYKESHRINKVAELLEKLGRRTEILDSGLIIHGHTRPFPTTPFNWDPDEDHRLAFAVAVARAAGAPITLENPAVVNKSFPEFWDITGWTE